MKTIFIKCLCLILLAMAGMTAGAQTFEVDGINYRVLSEAEGTVEVIGGDFDYKVVIPPSVSYNGNSYAVTTIGNSTFWGNDAIINIEISSVTTIKEMAFSGCSRLEKIDMPLVTYIGDDAFSGCSSLKSVFIPTYCTSIGIRAFAECSSMKEIIVNEDNRYYSSLYGVLYDKNKEILVCCPGSKTSIDIPSTVTTIGNNAFNGCLLLTSIDIPHVTTIDESAFYGCKSLASVNMPSATIIGGNAFMDCSSLVSVEMPSVTSIGEGAFYYCTSLGYVEMPSAITISKDAFYYCDKLTSAIISSATIIGDYAFAGCESLTSIDMPSVSIIGEFALAKCFSLAELNIPSTATKFGAYALMQSNSISSVYCHWEEPLECDPDFADEVYENATLYVPVGTTNAYRSVYPPGECASGAAQRLSSAGCHKASMSSRQATRCRRWHYRLDACIPINEIIQ